MSDAPEPPNRDDFSDTPIAPGDVASAARSCQVIILILLALVIIACIIVAITLVR